MRRCMMFVWSLLLLFMIPTSNPPVRTQTLDKLDPLLQQRVSDSSGHSQVIVRAHDNVPIGTLAVLIQQVGGTVGRELPILDAQAGEVPNVSLLALADHPDVQRLALDRPLLGALERTGATIGAATARQELGYDGAGIGVAVMDSGVTSWHDDLRDNTTTGSQRVDHFIDFVNGYYTPYDDHGHGTHVAGIIAGNGFDFGGARAGIAPAARLVVLKILDASGRGRISDVIAAFDYVINHKDLFNIRVINLSVGAGVYESHDSDFLTLAAKRAVEQGIVVVAAAGNLGTGAQGTQYGGITAPGNAPWVLTVGAFSHMGSVDRSDDVMAAFSSRGPTDLDRTAKPDLVAPGVGIYSLSDPNSALYIAESDYLLSGTLATPYLPYLSLSGTSQAAPVVAGTVALMLQANPTLTPNAVKAILQYTARAYPAYNTLTQGAGFLNAQGAIELARSFAASSTTLGPLPVEWSGQVLWGNHRLQGGRLTADANAWSTGVVWGQPTTSDQQNVVWGVVCSSGDCATGGGMWSRWEATCADASCSTIVWGDQNAENVVWGTACGGADCEDTTWSTSEGVTVSWSSDEAALAGSTVIWGNILWE